MTSWLKKAQASILDVEPGDTLVAVQDHYLDRDTFVSNGEKIVVTKIENTGDVVGEVTDHRGTWTVFIDEDHLLNYTKE